MRKLQEVYDNNELYYWCNGLGELNVPGDIPSYVTSNIDSFMEELPPKQAILYEGFRKDGMYVVSYRRKAAMALCWLFDKDYMDDVVEGGDASKQFLAALEEYARQLEGTPLFEHCEFLIGENTDPIGHEFTIIVPFDQRSQIAPISEYLGRNIYHEVETIIRFTMQNEDVPAAEQPQASAYKSLMLWADDVSPKVWVTICTVLGVPPETQEIELKVLVTAAFPYKH